MTHCADPVPVGDSTAEREKKSKLSAFFTVIFSGKFISSIYEAHQRKKNTFVLTPLAQKKPPN